MFSFLIALAPAPGLAHELWLDAQEWQVAPGDTLQLNLRNGEGFKGVDLGWFAAQIARLDHIAGGAVTPVPGRMGDIPAVVVTAEPGLNVVIYQSTSSQLTYAIWEKFENFLRHKDAMWVQQAHAARGFSPDGITESYTRHAKALITAGPGGMDAPAGLDTEFVALADPAAPGLSAMPVRLLYQGQPRGDAQVEIFDRAPDGTVTVTLTRTDGDGMALIPVATGHAYLVDAVLLRPVTDNPDVQWHSLWAALTFAVPE